MYLASLYICFDLDPSIHQTDKDRLLLSLKEKLKQKFRNKLTLKIDDQENSLALAFFEHSYEKVPFYFNEILAAVYEDMCRNVLTSHGQSSEATFPVKTGNLIYFDCLFDFRIIVVTLKPRPYHGILSFCSYCWSKF